MRLGGETVRPWREIDPERGRLSDGVAVGAVLVTDLGRAEASDHGSDMSGGAAADRAVAPRRYTVRASIEDGIGSRSAPRYSGTPAPGQTV